KQRAIAVRGQEQEQRVAAGIHHATQVLQNALQVLRRRQRKLVHRARMIDESDGSAPSAEPLVEQLPNGDHLALEHRRWAVSRKAHEIEMPLAIVGGLQVSQGSVDKLALAGKRLTGLGQNDAWP